MTDLASQHKQPWHKNDDFVHAWYEAHDEVVDHYSEKVQFYADKFIASELGQKLKEATAATRKAQRKLLGLDEHVLRSFNGADGIQWGIEEIYDIFEILTDMTETKEFELVVLSHLNWKY